MNKNLHTMGFSWDSNTTNYIEEVWNLVIVTVSKWNKGDILQLQGCTNLNFIPGRSSKLPVNRSFCLRSLNTGKVNNLNHGRNEVTIWKRERKGFDRIS